LHWLGFLLAVERVFGSTIGCPVIGHRTMNGCATMPTGRIGGVRRS
jgi:hypothetical protein